MTDARKVVVISGGMGGVGRATAEAFAREQYRVVILHRQSGETWGDHMFMQCDVRDAKQVARVVDDIVARTGRIDTAVHAAVDPIVREKILTMDDGAFRSQFEAGFFGAFHFFRPIAEIIKKQKEGTLIGITSNVIESDSTPARMGAYTVGKIAFRGLLRELHRELSPSGIRVFAVAPGLMRTRLNADLPDKFFDIARAKSGTALTTPEDTARTIVQLCADTSIPSGRSYLVSSNEWTLL